jgi:hypothetical protein
MCAAQVTDRKALVRAEISSMVDDFSIILKTSLTAICDILYPAEIHSPAAQPFQPSDALHSSDTPGPLALSSPASLVEAARKEKALMLVAELWKADGSRRKQLRKQAKAAQVFSSFEKGIQKANSRRKTGLEGRIRQH